MVTITEKQQQPQWETEKNESHLLECFMSLGSYESPI